MELNPNHPVSQQMHDHWHKICALLMRKMGRDHIVITMVDLRSFPADSFMVFQELEDGLHLRLVDEAEAVRLARREGGLPT